MFTRKPFKTPRERVARHEQRIFELDQKIDKLRKSKSYVDSFLCELLEDSRLRIKGKIEELREKIETQSNFKGY